MVVKRERILKILADINLDQPLLRGTTIKYSNQKVWVKFRYENLAMFCFFCGRVGHAEKNCADRKCTTRQGRLIENQFGEWIRAEIGRLGGVE